MIKKFAIISLIALIHFGLSVAIVPTAMTVATGNHFEQAETSIAFQILVVATTILHFPIISLSLYSRQWFPGGWIYVPILINSCLWAVGIYFLLVICRKMFKEKN